MKQNRVLDIVDSRIKEECKPEQVLAVAKLARRCLSLKGKKRSSMREVSSDLEKIRSSIEGLEICGSQRLRRLEDGLLQGCGHPDSDGVKPEIFLCALLDASSVEARAASISSSSVMFVLQRCLGVSFSACRVGGPGSPVSVNLGFSLVCLLCRLCSPCWQRVEVSGGGGSVRPAGSLWQRVGELSLVRFGYVLSPRSSSPFKLEWYRRLWPAPPLALLK
ncbi:hypothetical protein YC2023_023665 [Brassica napus]